MRPSNNMDIVIEKIVDIEVFRISGKLTINNIDQINNEIKPLLNDQSISKILLNLKNVTFLDSSGIGFLVTSYRTMKRRDAELYFCELNKTVEEIFISSELRNIFTVFESETEAINQVSGN